MLLVNNLICYSNCEIMMNEVNFGLMNSVLRELNRPAFNYAS